MKKFLLHIFGLLVGLLLIMAVLDVLYTQVYRNMTVRSKFQFIRSFKDKKIDYIFLGSSRVENGINPLLIEEQTNKKCVNFGIPASKLEDIYTVLQLLDSYNIQSEKIFIQVDYIFNVNERSNILQYQFLPFIRDNQKTKESLRYLDDFNASYYLPFYRYCANDFKIGLREFSLSVAGKKTKLVKHNGFVPRIEVASMKSDAALPSEINANNAAFDRIDAYCKKNNIDVVYFCAPFMKETKNLDFAEKLQKRIPNLKNYARLIDNDSLFMDGLHLNARGATFLTNYMIADLKLK